jgi:hypothetical protein
VVRMCCTRRPSRCVGGGSSRPPGTVAATVAPPPVASDFASAYYACQLGCHTLPNCRPASGMSRVAEISVRWCQECLLCCCAAGCWALGSHCYQ